MKKKLPRWIKILWVISIPGYIIFVGRMIYEHLWLTYKYGEQMIGFSLVHQNPLLFFSLILSYFLALTWLLVFTIWFVVIKFRGVRTEWIFAYFLTLLLFFIQMILPYISKTLL